MYCLSWVYLVGVIYSASSSVLVFCALSDKHKQSEHVSFFATNKKSAVEDSEKQNIGVLDEPFYGMQQIWVGQDDSLNIGLKIQESLRHASVHRDNGTMCLQCDYTFTTA